MANYRAREELFAPRLLEWLTLLSGSPEAAISSATLPLVGDGRGAARRDKAAKEGIDRNLPH